MYRLTVQQQREMVMEAERRVRAGEPRAEVARALGIPVSTVATWAHRGGWRRKDLVTFRSDEMGQLALKVMTDLSGEESERKQNQAAELRKALEASRAEFQAIAPVGQLPGPQLPGPMGEGPVPARKLAMAMADSLLRQGRLEDADRAIRLAVRFAEADQAAGAREEANWREERERLTKWWAEKQTAYHQLHQAAQLALEEVQAQMALEETRSAEDCCPKCGRRMDFWPEEVDGSDEDDLVDDFDDDDSGRRDSDDDFGKGRVDDDFSDPPPE